MNQPAGAGFTPAGRIVLAAFIALTGVGCSAATADGTRSATKTADRFLLDRLGQRMTETAARHALNFRPFAPPRRILAVALLAPFHGDDERANRGIGYEYFDVGDHRYVLAQWPSHGGRIATFLPLNGAEPGCPGARSFSRGTRPSGIVWTTPHGLVMTLQPDGENDAQTLVIEWKKLVRRGICR